MSRHCHLPVWKAALDLAVHLEHAVPRFPRYRKYTQGSAGHHKTGSKCRETLLIWRPPGANPSFPFPDEVCP